MRWRPRFSLRTLTAIVTLVCVYMAMWPLTVTRGVKDVKARAGESRIVEARLPLIIRHNSHFVIDNLEGNKLALAERYHYYFWFFGYCVKLRYERNIPVEPLPTWVDQLP